MKGGAGGVTMGPKKIRHLTKIAQQMEMTAFPSLTHISMVKNICVREMNYHSFK